MSVPPAMPTLKGSWNYPTRVLFGPGRIAELADACKTAGIAKPLLVTDKGLENAPITHRAMEIMKARRSRARPVRRGEGQPDLEEPR